MQSKAFYEIEEKNYLFKEKANYSKGRKRAPEEPVRQWAIFELITSYGIRIDNIDIEVPAGAYSQQYHADIVVFREKKPYIVVECKRDKSSVSAEKVLKQAADYANSLNTSFIVYATRGIWEVRRKWEGQWIPVPDIPRQADFSGKDTITPLFWFINSVAPLLFWLHRQVPAKHSIQFSRFLQEFLFCNAGSRYFEQVNLDLITAAEHLAKVMLSGKEDNLSFTVESYQEKKLKAAFLYFQDYFRLASLDKDTTELDFYDYRGLLGTLADQLSKSLELQRGIQSEDACLSRLALAMIYYLVSLYKHRRYDDIPVSLVNEFEKFIEFVLISQIGLSLPDALDEGDFKSLISICSEPWNLNNGQGEN